MLEHRLYACLPLDVFCELIKKVHIYITYFIHYRPRITTVAPPDIVIPPDEVIPDEIGGGGFVLDSLSGVGDKPGAIGIGGPGGSLTPIGGVSVSGGSPIPLAATGVGPAPPALAGGARAGAVVGTLLGNERADM